MGKINAVVRYGVMAVVVGVVWCGLGLAAEDDAALRKKALRFNKVTGDGPMAGAVLSLTKENADGKKLIAAAAHMAKDKPPPFNINALRILSTASLALKEYDAAEVFYRLFIDEANKLHSSRKVALGHVGLITTLNTAKKFDECEKECLRFLEVQEFDEKDELESNEDKQRRNYSDRERALSRPWPAGHVDGPKRPGRRGGADAQQDDPRQRKPIGGVAAP